MPVATKMMIEVTAGIVPGREEKEFTKQYLYMSDDYDSDLKLPPHQQKMGFLMAEAYEYARALPVPHALNWVTVDVVWL